MADSDVILLHEVRIFGDRIPRTGEAAGEREGLTLEEQPGSSPRSGTPLPMLAFAALFVITVFLIVLSFPAGAYSVYSGRLSQSFTYDSAIRPYFWIGPSAQYAPFVVSAGAWYAVLMAFYLLFFAYALSQKEHFWGALRAGFRTGFEALTSSPFVVTVVSIGFLIFSSSLVDLLVSSAGAPIGGPTGDPLELFLGFSIAPLVEEVGFRLFLIGTVALILSLGRPWRAALGALWRPSRVLEGVAVGSGVSMIIWAATGFSAVTFGACHVVCGGGSWDVGKLPEAIYGGFVLGYLYVRYGLHVAVLAHWGVDFFGSVYAFFGQAAYGIPWDSATKEFAGQYLVDIDMLFLFGLASFLLVVYLGLKKIARWRSTGSSGEFKAPPTEGVAEP